MRSRYNSTSECHIHTLKSIVNKIELVDSFDNHQTANVLINPCTFSQVDGALWTMPCNGPASPAPSGRQQKKHPAPPAWQGGGVPTMVPTLFGS